MDQMNALKFATSSQATSYLHPSLPATRPVTGFNPM